MRVGRAERGIAALSAVGKGEWVVAGIVGRAAFLQKTTAQAAPPEPRT
jgi:hypothetical protein